MMNHAKDGSGYVTQQKHNAVCLQLARGQKLHAVDREKIADLQQRLVHAELELAYQREDAQFFRSLAEAYQLRVKQLHERISQ